MTNTHRQDTFKHLPYRPCVGAVVINAQGLIFVGERIDTPGAWQMPQGGIDLGETPRDAVLREVREEIGIEKQHALILAQSKQEYFYDLPDHLIGKMWGGNYRGQRQVWFALRFTGSDKDIDIHVHDQEFSRWRWSPAGEVLENIVPFKRDIYERILGEFTHYLD